MIPMFSMILTITYRMNRSNQKYILVLAISLLVVISFVYLASNNQNEAPLNVDGVWSQMAGIQNGAQSILQKAGIVPPKVLGDNTCERDDFVEMSEYLDIRRTCLLKYCGDVCITKQESEKGKDYMLIKLYKRHI